MRRFRRRECGREVMERAGGIVETVSLTEPRSWVPIGNVELDGRVFRAAIIFVIALGGAACQPSRGGEGQPCGFKGSLGNGAFICEGGLTCVESGAVCVRLHSEPVGGPCDGTNDACAEGLACSFLQCAAPLGAGQGPCYATGCAAGLTCLYQDNGDSQCGPPLGQGESCSEKFVECADGLVCLSACDGGTECLQPDAGSHCGNDQDAGSGNIGPDAGAR